MRKSSGASQQAPSASASMQARLRYTMPLPTSLLEPNRPITEALNSLGPTSAPPRSQMSASDACGRLLHRHDL